MENINEYKECLSKGESLSIDLWYDIVMIFRAVQWSIIHVEESHKNYILTCLADFMCELDNFRDIFTVDSVDYKKTYISIMERRLIELESKLKEKLSEQEIRQTLRRIEDALNKIEYGKKNNFY